MGASNSKKVFSVLRGYKKGNNVVAGLNLGLCIDTDIRRYIDRYDIIYLSAERFCRYLDIYRRRYMRYIGVFPHC